MSSSDSYLKDGPTDFSYLPCRILTKKGFFFFSTAITDPQKTTTLSCSLLRLLGFCIIRKLRLSCKKSQGTMFPDQKDNNIQHTKEKGFDDYSLVIGFLMLRQNSLPHRQWNGVVGYTLSLNSTP